MAKIEKMDVVTAQVLEQQYDKQQLMTSHKYAHRRDLVAALLVDGKTYPIDEIDALIKSYDERKM